MIHDYYLKKSNLDTGLEALTLKKVGELKMEVLKNVLAKREGNLGIFYPSRNDLSGLPINTTLTKFTFTLKKSFTSKNEGEFYLNKKKNETKIHENPIVRDRFTGLPMVRPSTWKGHLRFAADRVDWDDGEKERIVRRLFGAGPEDKNMLRGRLYLYPTFFEEEADYDVITPLSRDSRKPVRGPIGIEVMKTGRKGKFFLLYLPYPRGNDFTEKEVRDDLKFVAKALTLMFYTYGFSAKKTSGFGVVEEKLEDGELWVRRKTCDQGICKKCFSTLFDLEARMEEIWQ
ncbi:MAG: hypothetical protein H5T41_00730 [Methanomassiliicoccales archaeon]|nr:hypothetical protein [Methanomassiliicoccales archaeon]